MEVAIKIVFLRLSMWMGMILNILEAGINITVGCSPKKKKNQSIKM